MKNKLCITIITLLITLGAVCSDDLRQRAEKGDPEAMFQLGNQYFYGEKKAPELAAYWYAKAAEKNLPEAIFNYAWCLENGMGVNKDEFTAYQFYTKAAEKGIQEAAFNAAMTLMRGIEGKLEPDPVKAKAALEELAFKKKFPPAQAEVAKTLLMDKDDPSAGAEAFAMLSEAARKNSSYAKIYTLLADCHYEGRGTTPNVKKAVPQLEKAAALGSGEAALKRAFIAETGLDGTLPDTNKAIEYYTLAAKADVPEAQYKLAGFIKLRLAAGPEEDAEKLYEKAAEKGHTAASFKLAEIRLDRDHDKRQAVEMILSAAQKGVPDAQRLMARLWDGERKILKPDAENAFFWYRAAADRGDPAAQRETAIRLFSGKGCVQNDAQGAEYLRLAAKNGDVIAIQMLRRNSRTPW